RRMEINRAMILMTTSSSISVKPSCTRSGRRPTGRDALRYMACSREIRVQRLLQASRCDDHQLIVGIVHPEPQQQGSGWNIDDFDDAPLQPQAFRAFDAIDISLHCAAPLPRNGLVDDALDLARRRVPSADAS